MLSLCYHKVSRSHSAPIPVSFRSYYDDKKIVIV